jgi:eukaryotic-like serine/threonine-protein kinase
LGQSIIPDLITSAPIFSIGELVSGVYEVRSVLGSGGMGQVFEAQDTVLNRRVALKVAWPDLHESIRKEAQALAAVRHPSMVTVYTVGEHRSIEYIVMERVYGVPMDAYLGRRKAKGERLPASEAIELLSAIGEGLQAVHRAGIAHRDVKPANIMLAPGNRVVLMDFGLFLPEFDMAGQPTVAGSPQYMAPEAIANEVEPGAGHLVDLYALGVLAFEMLAGELPFGGDDVNEVWDKHVNQPAPELAPLRPDAPRGLVALVGDLMAKDPRDRPQSVEAVLWQLAKLRGHAGQRAEQLAVLIVDDDPQIQRVLSFYVRKAVPDAEIRTASDGDGALEQVRQRAPDLMLLDLQMPRMNGIEVCMYLRGARMAERCTIVSVSAGAQEHDVQLMQQLGITRFVSKGPGLGERIVAVTQDVVGQISRAR